MAAAISAAAFLALAGCTSSLLRDDETTVQLPGQEFYPYEATWIGSGLYITGAPASDPGSLGARLLAIDGHSIAAVLAKLAPEIDFQDSGVLREQETGAPWNTSGLLNDAGLLSWLGITRSSNIEELTLRSQAVLGPGDPGRGCGLCQVQLVPIGSWLRTGRPAGPR